MPYSEVKEKFKKAIAFSKSSKVISAVCHNLAIVNYYEIMAHNEAKTAKNAETVDYEKMALAEHLYKQAGMEDKIKEGKHTSGKVEMKVSDIMK